MTSSPTLADVASAAYQTTTDGSLLQAHDWQADLYAPLAAPDSDAGYLLLSPTGAGRIEAVVIPTLGLRRGGAPRRLFLIGPDGSPLDDYLYRLVPYLHSSALADETPRTVCLDVADEEDDAGNVCRRFFSDGAEDPAIVTNPLEGDVDLVLTTFSRFRELFWGSGGVHALPSAFAAASDDPIRRDLFFFDEAHLYIDDAFSRFLRLIEFLYAEDADIIVGSSTMPPAFAEELSFLETRTITSTVPPRTLSFQPAADPVPVMEASIRRSYFQNSRVFGVVESPEEAARLFDRLNPSYPHSVFLYHEAQAADSRRRAYAQLRELEKEGEGYLLLTTGNALESADLDATTLFSTLCPPENLIRRAGRCNRRGDLPSGQIVLIGEQFAPTARPLNPSQSDAYLAALRDQTDAPFDPDFWKAFI